MNVYQDKAKAVVAEAYPLVQNIMNESGKTNVYRKYRSTIYKELAITRARDRENKAVERHR
jgi:catabolite regulation protein CreA